ncbi:class A beta-lactamase [Cellulomonas endophytica]|uniref:class A beta-lactamase n=1 Tax=Cellulomonas endophytica TaxID=2494735 RepID=UPI001F0CC9D3|nr:class A beta-lactamase [Cellulomonas endophytica]
MTRRRCRAAAAGLLVALLVAASGACAAGPGRSTSASSATAPTSAPGRPSAAPSAAATPPATTPEGDRAAVAAAAFAGLESATGARLGVWALDTATGRTVEHRADERFGLASTHKVLSVAALLAALRPGDLDAVVHWPEGDVVAHSPVTAGRGASGLTWREVAAAALVESDNTAANLVLERVGGPAGLTGSLRAWGDTVTRSDRTEPALNEVAPGDERDTTTPRALATDVHALLLGDAPPDGLTDEDRGLLLGWMRASTTGTGLVRAGVPDGWVVADRSGTGSHGARNDVAVVHPPGGAPVVLAVLTRHDDPDALPDDDLLARATEVALAGLGLTG